MPITQAIVDRLLADLQAARPITSRKMFGGVGIYADDVFFAVIDDDKLYFKVDDGNRAAYDDAGMEPWVIAGETPTVQPYREVPEAVRLNPEALKEWIGAAVEVALRKKKKKK